MTETNAPSRRTVLTALGVAPLAAAAVPAVASADRVPDELRPGGEFDRYLAGLAAEEKFSGTVLLSHRGKPVLQRSHHLADRARGIPNGPRTSFANGSITKMFTTFAIAQLAEQGRIGYGEKAGAYVDFLRPDVAAATVHQLITHTSGLGDFHSRQYFEQAKNWDSVEKFWDGTLGFVRECTLSFPPGAGQQYSNAGYFILGAIVAQVSGRGYYDYVREHVFARAGMTGADFVTRPEWQAGRSYAHPYTKNENGEWVDNLDSEGFIGLPPGGAHTTAPDLVAFARAVQDNRLLGEQHTTLVMTPKLPMGTDNTRWETYGVGSALLNGRWSFGHNGGNTNGVSCNVDWYPATDWVAVILGNGGFRTAEPLARKARELISRL